MTLENKINQDIEHARKNHMNDTLAVLKIIKADIQNEAINKKSDLTESEALAIVKRHVKQTDQALEFAIDAGRKDLVDYNTSKLDLLGNYLPPLMTEQEIFDELVAMEVEKGRLKFGQIMGMLMKKHGDIVDPVIAKKVISENFV